MRIQFFEYFGCLRVLFLITISLSSANSAQAQEKAVPGKEFALIGAKIYPTPDARPISNGVIVVANGKILSVGEVGAVHIPSGVPTLDATGKTIVAGLWNSHVHFVEPKWDDAGNLPATQLASQMRDMLTQYGFTSVVDTGSSLKNTVALRRRVTSGEVAGPRILTSGMIIFPENGLPYYITESMPAESVKLFKAGEASTPADAVRIVDEQIAQGADIVKLYAVTWLKRDGKIVPYAMALPTVKAATDEAHRKGKLVFAHPSTMEGARLVLDGHVDVLAHAIEEPDNWDAALSARLKKANVAMIPTLTLFSKDPQFDAIMSEVKSHADVHGQLMFGTDIGYLTDYQELTKEYGYMERAGLTFPQILASLTTSPTERFGYAKRTGKVKTGMDADLTVLEADPARDISAFARVAMTIREGQIIYQKPSD